MKWAHGAFGALILLLVTSCAAAKPAPPSVQVGPTAGPEVLAMQTLPVPIEAQMAGKTGIVHMTVTEQGFHPAVIQAPEGGQVRIHLRNAGTTGHNLVIPRHGIVTGTLRPGDETYVEFTAGEKGSWPLYSEAESGPEKGLSGVLQVDEPAPERGD